MLASYNLVWIEKYYNLRFFNAGGLGSIGTLLHATFLTMIRQKLFLNAHCVGIDNVELLDVRFAGSTILLAPL